MNTTKAEPKRTEQSTHVALVEAKAVIAQSSLKKFIRFKNRFDKDAEKLKTWKEDLIALLDSGAEVEEGTHIAKVHKRERRNPAWKAEAIALSEVLFGAGSGPNWEKEVFDRTIPGKYDELEVK